MTGAEDELPSTARGDRAAFDDLVVPLRPQLHAYCYRMLGSTHDADDALQEVLLRAWRGLVNFEGRSSVRSWCYRIATNVCLNMVQRRPKRVLPLDPGAGAAREDGSGEPPAESVWIEPYPDSALGISNAVSAPESSYEQRERRAGVRRCGPAPAGQRAGRVAATRGDRLLGPRRR